jgi:dihydropyrimidine dehydrogenase (NAD+) subunit PreA
MCPEPKADLSVEFCGVEFEHPFILAAAPATDDPDMVRDAFRAGWAGAVLKTTSVEGTPVHLAYPQMSGMDLGRERMVGLGNIDLISRHHIDVVEKRIADLKGEFPDNVVVASIAGHDGKSWREVAGRAVAAGADMIEASFSCPQGSQGLAPGMMLGQDSKASAEVAGWIKKAAGKAPIIIKLTPQVADIAAIADAVKGAGADGVCVGNTIPAIMGVDINTFVPYPDVYGYSTYSGLSGPAIKPISLRCVAEVAKRAKMPIAASGGAASWQDALEFILLGSSVVQFCTAVMHRGFGIVDDMKDGLTGHLDARGISTLRDVIGAALPKIVPHDELDSSKGAKGWRPVIDEGKCVRCGMCMIACRDGAHRAIALDANRFPAVDDGRCVGCGLCSLVCPAYCIEMKQRD